MKRIVVVALAILLSHGVAFAGVVTDTLNVTAQISTDAGECTVSVPIPIDFGISDGTAFVETQGELAVQCPADMPYYVALDAGQYYLTYRNIYSPANGGYLISYDLNNPDGIEWGDDGLTYNAPSLAGVGSGTPQALPITGILHPGLSSPVPEGTYSDVVNVTVSY